MHRLNRPQEPACLQRYRQGNYQWKHVTSADKASIWQSLNKMQDHRCAYCEIHIFQAPRKNQDGHIEHFRQRSRYPQATFSWENLFGSCSRADSCGKHKDKQSYDPHNLIKMDIENPSYFLTFFKDGHVEPRKNLTAQEYKRAEETIRVFNLNGPLRPIRESHVAGYAQTAQDLLEIGLELGAQAIRPLLDAELNAVSGKQFETAIRHILEYAR